MDIVTLLILIGATWRLSSLLADESGPFDIFTRLRYLVGVRFDENSQPYGENVFAKAFTCVWCISIWMGTVLVIIYSLVPTFTFWICLPFALSAGAIRLNK